MIERYLDDIKQYLDPSSGRFVDGQPVLCSQIPGLELYMERLIVGDKYLRSYIQLVKSGDGAQMLLDVRMHQIAITDFTHIAALFTWGLRMCTGIALHLEDNSERGYVGLAHISEHPDYNLEKLVNSLKDRFRVVDLAVSCLGISTDKLCTVVDSLSRNGKLNLQNGFGAERLSVRKWGEGVGLAAVAVEGVAFLSYHNNVYSQVDRVIPWQ